MVTIVEIGIFLDLYLLTKKNARILNYAYISKIKIQISAYVAKITHNEF